MVGMRTLPLARLRSIIFSVTFAYLPFLRMKIARLLFLPVGAAVLATGLALTTGELNPGKIEVSVGSLLEQGHYSRKKLDDTVSQTHLTNYLETLDYNHLFFLQKDVDEFTKKYATTLDERIGQGDTEAPFAIFKVYKARVEARIAKTKSLLSKEYTFDSDRFVEVNRQKSAWPKDEAEADKIWEARVENELLASKLTKSDKDPIKRLTKRYDELLRSVNEQNNEDIMKNFLLALAQTYDPHSEYMSKSELENFEINMRLSLVGIGAVLQSDEGYARIAELVPGGPASKSGMLKVGDRISGVAQGPKEFVDTVDMKLDKVVGMIRGKKDTLVRLQVLPANAADPSVRKVVEIKRDEVKLKEAEAKAEIVDRVYPDGKKRRIGWITLPSFYADMGRQSSGAKSTTRDVQTLLNRLKQEGIEGLVMDLRRNGGGSLEEAVNLTGLFIKKGPVVQAKGSNRDINVLRDRDSSVAYDGPMVVLTNKLSASASEIFAAALQDYNRAVIVGDSSTFGKGTVQTMLEVGQVMPFLGGGSKEAGALKLTIQKFYRVAGGSTQLKGVEPDVILPSTFDHPDIGESSLKAPLPYDTVEAASFEPLDRPLFKSELKTRAESRIGSNPEFTFIREDLKRIMKRYEENRLSLNLAKRTAEIDEEKERKAARKDIRAKLKATEDVRYTVTLDNAGKPGLELYKPEEKKDKDKESKPESDEAAEDEEEEEAKTPVDAIRNEAIDIMNDLVTLTNEGGVAKAKTVTVK